VPSYQTDQLVLRRDGQPHAAGLTKKKKCPAMTQKRPRSLCFDSGFRARDMAFPAKCEAPQASVLVVNCACGPPPNPTTTGQKRAA
jgi:hypothetical protein